MKKRMVYNTIPQQFIVSIYSFKHEEAYLTQYNNIRDARATIGHIS